MLVPNQVLLPGVPNNEGFDALVLHRVVGDGGGTAGLHLVIFEFKNSAVDAETTLSWGADSVGVRRKVEKVRDFLQVSYATHFVAVN